MKNFTFLTNLRNSNQVMTRLRPGNNQVNATWRFIALLTLIFTLGVGNVWGASATWALVTSEPSDWSGEYLIVYNSNCFDGSLTSGFNGNAGQSVSISNNKITKDDSYSLTVSKVSSKYYLQTASGYYIGRSANSNGVDASTTRGDTYEVTFSSWNGTNKTVKIAGTGGRCLGNNSGSWKFFSSSNAYVNVSLYKKEASCSNQVTITNSSTTNVTHGSFDVDKTGAQDACSALSVTVTTNPDAHYHVASISASNPTTTGTAGAAVDNGDGTYTITYSANAKGNSTISVTYAEDDKHTLTFYNNGVATGDVLEVYDGLRFFDMYDEDFYDESAWPTLTDGDACHATSTKFAGWTTENVGRTPVHTIDVDKIVDWWTEIDEDMDINALWGTIPASATTTFAAADYSAATAPVTKSKDNITLYFDAGQIYKTNTPYTFSITSGNHYFSITSSDKVLAKLATTCNDGTYCIKSVSDGTLNSSSSASQTVTGINTYTVECYPKSDKQIRMQTCAVYCYDNYITSCCGNLDPINGSVNVISPVSTEVSWDNVITGVSSWTVKYKVHGAGAWTTWDGAQTVYTKSTTNDSRKVTITTTCNTAYDYLIIANPSSGYCDKEEELNNSNAGYNSGTWSVSSSITNGSKTSVPTTACGDYTATFAASDGYHFPDAITVTGASSHTWTKATGTLTISGANITGDITIGITCPMNACDDYSFYYGTTKGSEDNFECFSFVTGSTDTWLTDLWTIPSADQWTYVGEPEWDADPGKSANLQLSNMPYALNHANNLGAISTGVMEGAQGYVKICTNSTDANRYVGFIPAGYVFRWGTDGGGWNSIAFSPEDEDDIEEEDWYTPIQTWTSSNAADYTYVGLKTSSGYVWANRSETRRPVFFKPNANWLSPDGASKDPKFAMYYYTSDDAYKGWSAFMEDPDGDGIYEAWIPNDHDYAKVIFVRFPNSKASTGNWDNEMNQTGNLTLQSDKNVFTLAAGKWGTEADEGTWSLYDKKGKFHISANSNTNNWYCHFWPHYVLHYDANSGSGAPADQSVALDASPCQLTVSSTAPTRSNYTFLGWNESSSATSPDGDWDGGDTHAMTGDVTLYAVWAANHTLTYNYNGGDGSSCSGGTKYTGESFTACSSAGSKTGYSFTGWKDGSGNDYTAGSNYTMPNSDLTLTAQWSVNSYDVTLTTNGGTINAGNVTSYTYGVGATLPTNVTRDGYRFDGWFSDDGVWSDQVTAISTTATGDKTYYAKWTAVYTVTWHVGNGTWSVGEHNVNVGNTQVASGGKIGAMPDAPADNTLSACASKFMGWSKKSWGATPKGTGTGEYDDLFTTVGGSPAISAATDFYAVFAEQSNSDGYKYIGDDGTLTDGKKYIFVSSKSAGSAYALKATDLAAPNSGNNGTAVSVTVTSNAEGVLVTTINTALEFEYVSSGTKLKYEVDGPATRYLFINGDGVGMKSDESRSRYTTDAGLQGWNNKVTTYYDVYYNSTNEKFEKKESADSRVYAFIKQTPTYSNYRTQCDPNIVKVTYNANGGSTTCAGGSHDKRNDYTVCSSAPTKDYYSFAGWLCSADDEVYAASATIDDAVIDADFTLTAQWTPVPYNITYELYGGTNSGSNPATYNVTTATITLQDPTKGHDRFEGWYSTYSAGVYSDQVTSIPLGSHGAITLHAKWTARHEIIFDADGATTTIYRADDEDLSASVAGQGSVPSDPSAPTACSSKVFVGWSESTIDGETDDEPGDLMKPAAGTVNANKHYYAVWAIEESETGTVTVFEDALNISGTDAVTSRSGWSTISYVEANSGDGVKLSSKNNAATMTVDLRGKSLESTLIITFQVKQYSDESGYIDFDCLDDGTTASFSPSTISSITDATWTNKTCTVSTVNAATQSITLNGQAKARVYIRNFKITQTGTVYNYSAYSTSCCATKIVLSDPSITDASSSGSTITFDKSSPVYTCGGTKTVTATLTLIAGYQASALSFAVNSGTVSISPAISTPITSSQVYTLTFAEDQNATLTTTATIAAKPLNSITLAETEVTIYDQQYVQIGVTYDPADILTKGYTLVSSPTKVVTTGSTQTQFKISATKAGVVISSETKETVSIKANADNTKTASVEVTILPLPKVHFVDNVHNESFSDVVATIEDNALSATKSTPTHEDFDGSTLNTCEEQHLHLVGWIDGDWDPYKAYMNGTGAKPDEATITGATGYFYAPGADIDVSAKDGKTYYAVWAKVE